MTEGTAEPIARPLIFDAFLSHASQDAKFAARVGRSLQGKGLNPWIDGSDLAFGALLRDELQDAIRNSRALVLLWSKAASQSRWVMAEIFTAFHLDRFIIPCVLDETPLPQFLQNAAYLNRQRDQADIGEKLARAIRAAPRSANKVTPWMGSRTQEAQSRLESIGARQISALLGMTDDFRKAAKANADVGKELKQAAKLAPYDPMILNLTGYQCKNDYMFAHWAEIDAGRAPSDPLLHQGERKFFEALCVIPTDVSGVNGLGSILILERELDAAEFFVRRAIDLAKSAGGDYMAAEHDLKLILVYKRKPATL
jgi:TIR domain